MKLINWFLILALLNFLAISSKKHLKTKNKTNLSSHKLKILRKKVKTTKTKSNSNKSKDSLDKDKILGGPKSGDVKGFKVFCYTLDSGKDECISRELAVEIIKKAQEATKKGNSDDKNKSEIKSDLIQPNKVGSNSTELKTLDSSKGSTVVIDSSGKVEVKSGTDEKSSNTDQLTQDKDKENDNDNNNKEKVQEKEKEKEKSNTTNVDKNKIKLLDHKKLTNDCLKSFVKNLKLNPDTKKLFDTPKGKKLLKIVVKEFHLTVQKEHIKAIDNLKDPQEKDKAFDTLLDNPDKIDDISEKLRSQRNTKLGSNRNSGKKLRKIRKIKR